MNRRLNLIYIGDDFYLRSGTIMSPCYTMDGKQSSLGEVDSVLKECGTVTCRKVTNAELEKYEAELLCINEEWAKMKETI